MKINKIWHQSHKVPKSTTLEQRIEWHIEHLKNCQCRTDMPPKLKSEMKKRKFNYEFYKHKIVCEMSYNESYF